MTRRLGQTIVLENNAYSTAANAQYLADSFRSAFPGGRLNWAVEHQVVSSSAQANVDQIAFVANQAATYGDSVSLWSAFSLVRVSTATAISTLQSLIPSLRTKTGASVDTICAWAIPSAVLPTAVSLGVQAVTAQVWGQRETDGFSGEGSPNVPYYPSKNHFLVPAQDPANALNVVLFDNLSSGYWESLRSRITIHPIDARTLARMQAISADYLDAVTEFPFMSALCEVSWVNNTTYNDPTVYQNGTFYARDRLIAWWQWLAATYPSLSPVTLSELGTAWRTLHPFSQGNRWNITHQSADPTNATNKVTWTFTPRERVAVVTTAQGKQLADRTVYSDALTEPTPRAVDSSLEPGQDWGLPGRPAQKRILLPGGPLTGRSYGQRA